MKNSKKKTVLLFHVAYYYNPQLYYSEIKTIMYISVVNKLHKELKLL